MQAQTQYFHCGACDIGLTGPTTKCNTAATCVTYAVYNDFPAATNYTWTITPAADGTIISTTSTSICVKWTNLTSTTQIDVTDNFCGGTETLCVRPCATNIPGGYTDVQDPNSLDIPGVYINGFGGLQVDNALLFIQGTFTVDHTIRFTHCQFYMGTGATILVDYGQELKFETCVIQAPQITGATMWKGIETRNNTTLSISNSTIRDALYAMNLRGQYTTLTLLNSNLFESNYISLLTSDCPNQHVIITTSGFNYTVFSGDKPLENPYTCQPPNTSDFSYSAMLLKDVQLLTTDHGTAGTHIEFYRLNNGVVAYNSNLQIRNCHFNQITPLSFFDSNNANVTPAINGSGIYTEQSIYYAGITNDIGGTDAAGDIYSNTFYNCKRGVYINKKANCRIVGNTFDLMTRAGVEIKNCKQGSNYLNIDHNNFSHFQFGLKAYNIAKATADIHTNIFVDGNYGSAAFTGTAMHITNDVAAVVPLNLYNNTVSNTRIGLFAANINKANIWGNTMQFEQGYAVLGAYKHFGIWLDRVSNSNISFNYIYRNTPDHLDIDDIDKQLKAFNFKNCQTDILNTNTMTNMGTGMRFLADNQNTQLYCNAFNRHKQGVLLQNAKLLAQGSLNNPWDNTWNNFDPSDLRAAGSAFGMNPINWYHQYSTTYTNNYAPEPHSVFSVNPIGNQNSINACSISRGDSTLAEYLYAVIDSTIAYSTDSAENRFKDIWFAYCLLMGNDSLRQSDVAFQNFVATHSNTNVGELAYAEFLYSQQNYSAALAVLNNITPENLVDEYQKYTLTLAAENPDGDADLTESQVSTLTDIAYTNIWHGGDGVINARVRAGLEVDDEANELKIGMLSQNTDHINNYIIDNNFDLQQFVNAFNLKNYNSYAVYNTQGKLQWQNNYPLDFTVNLPKGIYLFNAHAANGNQMTIKLVSLK